MEKRLVAAILVGCLVAVAAGWGVSRALAPKPVAVGVGGRVSQADIDLAWQEALKIGGGNPLWVCPVTPERVIVVPSTLQLGPYTYYGITVTEPAFTDGRLVLVETVEIHLTKSRSCRIHGVLVHELLHIVGARRQLVDPSFQEVMNKFGSEEDWVRSVYPPGDMGVCP